MNKIFASASILMVAGFAGCQTPEHLNTTGGQQLIQLDSGMLLSIAVEGVDARPAATSAAETPVPKSRSGEPIHRILESGAGKVLFAYDLAVTKTATGEAYSVSLKPAAGKGPTFQGTRQVTVLPHEESVRVELMEQPDTGRKIVDVFRLTPAPKTAELHEMSFHSHLLALHERFRKWVNGE